MAFGGGTDTVLLINGYNLTSYFNASSPNATAGAYETSTYGVGSKTYIGGLKDARWSLGGFFDGAIAAVDEILAAALGVASGIATWFPQGDALGTAGRGISGHVVSHGSTSPVDGVVSTQAEIQSTVGSERVLSHRALGSVAAGTNNGTGIDNSAASTNGGVGYVQATADGGSLTSCVVKIQHSADNSTYADLITFATITATPAKERKAVTGTVNRYTRSQVVNDDAVTVQVAFGRK